MDAQRSDAFVVLAEGTIVAEAPLSFEAFFREHHPSLFAALCLSTGNREDANEIAQEAFVKVLERWDRVAVMDDPAGFLFRTAMNTFLKRLRRAKVAALAPMPRPERGDVFQAIDDHDVLARALSELTPRQRAAVVLTELLDYSSAEAGHILGIADSTVRVLAGRARAAMRTNVGELA